MDKRRLVVCPPREKMAISDDTKKEIGSVYRRITDPLPPQLLELSVRISPRLVGSLRICESPIMVVAISYGTIGVIESSCIMHHVEASSVRRSQRDVDHIRH